MLGGFYQIHLLTGVAYSEARWMFSAAFVCLFVSVFVCLFVSQYVCPHVTFERLNVGGSNLEVRYIVQKSHPSSKVMVKGLGH